MSRHLVQQVKPGATTLIGDTAHHLRNVLRIKPGDQLVVFDADGRQAEATVTAVRQGAVELDVGESSDAACESPLPLALAFALSKGEKPEWITQKAVELGVENIVIFQAERSVARWKKEALPRKLERLRSTIKGATAQCGRTTPADVSFAFSLEEALAKLAIYPLRIVFHTDADLPLASLLTEPTTAGVALLCGPEGGLTANELALLNDAGWQAGRMGPRILRAETAALAAVALVQGLLGDLTR